MLKSLNLIKINKTKLFKLSTSRFGNKRVKPMKNKSYAYESQKIIDPAKSKYSEDQNEGPEELEFKIKNAFNHVRFGLGLVVIAGGLIYTFIVMWEEYLTYKKAKHLNMLTYGILGLGAGITGSFVGNYIQSGSFAKTLPNTGIFFRGNRIFQYSIGIFLVFALTAELIDRNLFFWGAGTLASAGVIANYLIMQEGIKHQLLPVNLVKLLRVPSFYLIFLCVPVFMSYYKERSKEMKFLVEFKNRKNYVQQKE